MNKPYVNGQLLNKTESQKEAIRNKTLDGNNLEDRHKIFELRYVDKELRGTDGSIPLETFFPTSDFKDVVNEITNQLPTNFNVVGDQSDFLRKSLIEGSHIKNLLNSVYREILLSNRAFVLLKPKLSPEDSSLMVLSMELLPYENCFPEYDLFTGALSKLTYQENRVLWQADEEVNFVYTIVYEANTISTYIRNSEGKRIAGMIDDKIVENPFASLDLLPVVQFLSTSNRKSKPYTSKLVEGQLQLDNLNTNIENLINMHSNPIYTMEKTRRDWGGFPLGAGQILQLRDEEKFSVIKADMQLSSLDTRYRRKRDEIYKTAGLVPITLRDKLYGTDSSKVVKIASGELIGVARNIISNFKLPLMDIVRVMLFINGKKYLNEVISPPEEILPYDLETVFATMAVGMNLGLVDDNWFWDKYMPELADNEKDRIRESYKERYANGDIDLNTANVDNRAKVKTKPMGNKEQANSNAEEVDGNIRK
ncbi:MAG: hypothetical protein ACRC6E_08290 [Fusobacteriaceae bacterium]